MNRSLLLSIKPENVVKILNGEKTIEVRKKFLKNFTGWVYIYCTKDGGYGWRLNTCEGKITSITTYNGKVVARFWCDKVEEFNFIEEQKYLHDVDKYNEVINEQNELCKKACLSSVEMVQYLDRKCLGICQEKMSGYAINISKLEIFSEPRELSDFDVKKAPQNYCYVEGVEK